jgi:5-methyltetrahydrofolate--homocysteine methyltransferase
MSRVAAELERQGFTTPLLIGGATTSKVHTAVKIAPRYSSSTVYVTDASRAVGVASQLLSAVQRDGYADAIREEYRGLQAQFEGKTARTQLVSIDQARANAAPIDWDAYIPPAPRAPGVTAFDDYPLEDLVSRIDWGPFFTAWELRGAYPAILDDDVVGEEARRLLRDAETMLARIVARKLLRARAVVGLFPANSHGDDIEVYTDESRQEVRMVIHCLRQQMQKPPGRPNSCLADFVAPRGRGIADYVGGFAVTAGIGVDEQVAAFDADQDDYNGILVKVLADRLAEALAERLHERVRKELWGYAPDETLDNDALIHEAYRGIRPAPGYPACPDHTEKGPLFALLDATRHTSLQLTESFAMFPTAAVSGYYFSHPDSAYFGVGRIGRDQVEDYAHRKGMDLPTAEQWLSPNLGYQP